MESHVLNSYHQARFRTIGHKLLGTEAKGNGQSNDRYAQRWDQHWSRNQTINMTRSQDSSSDEDENIEVQELAYDERLQPVQPESAEEQILVEGDDYDVIQVYAVDPNLDLEASDDDDQEDFCIGNNINTITVNTSQEHLDEAEYLTVPDRHRKFSESQSIEDLNFNLETPVVSNVDEYFIKEDKDKDILAVKDEPVVKDVDEYFIKEERPKTPNVDDFFIKDKIPDELEVSKTVNVDEFFVSHTKPPENVVEMTVDQSVGAEVVDNAEVPINESDLEVLPNIEDLKRFLLEDMSYSKFKNAQRSCSLPQSPMHNLCLDIDDAKTCLSFEDLNLDLSDLTFDNDRDKSGSSNKSEDIPRTLTEEDVNSFLITDKPKTEEAKTSPGVITEDDLSQQDMEIEHTVESKIDHIVVPKIQTSIKIPKSKISTPIKSMVLNFCIEKSSAKKEPTEIKPDAEELVDVESCNDTIIPVLEANNLNSLLEQFEATEKMNSKPKRVKSEEPKVKSVEIKVKCADPKVKSVLTNGMRLQDAGVQLNKTKMRQILMPSTINASVRRSPSPVHSDHDYCSSKKRFSLPNIKGGQSLLKPEVLSSNNKILSSRHRSCKNKKVVYALSSDDESDKNKNLKPSDDSDIKLKKPSVKQTVKAIAQPTRKKLSPVHSVPEFKDKDKSNSSVIVKDACKASDTPCSQNSNGSIKLTIKNKSEVILNCDVKDSQKDKPIEKCKSSASEKTEAKKVEIQSNIKNKSVIKNIKEVDSNKKSVGNIEGTAKEEARPKSENFYTALFSNKHDVQVPTIQVKSEKRSFEEEISIAIKPNKDSEQPQKKKKLNLQEYKMRRNASSNNSSAQVSPEPIFPDMPCPFKTNKICKFTPNQNQTPPNGVAMSVPPVEQYNADAAKKMFDPIREASRKILMNTKKQKAAAMRRRDEDIVMSKIPKVENLELQPLISDAEMMKIAGMIPNEVLSISIPEKTVEKPQMPANIEEIVMVSIGVNTDDTVFKELQPSTSHQSKPQSPTDSKSLINFKIKKSEISKQNVFDSVKRDKKSPIGDKKPDTKIDRERFKDITKTLKKVERQVDTKMYSNSLFSSIQDTVMKKAPDESTDRKRSKSNSPKRKAPMVKATIIRDYDTKADHGEDKIILHLVKDRKKPQTATNIAQTDADPKFGELKTLSVKVEVKRPSNRKRNDSDMSMSSESSPVRKESPKIVERKNRRTRSPSKEKRSRSKDTRTRSRERYDKYRRSRSRSRSRSRRRRRSHSRSRSKSRGRFRRYRRSDSPYRRKRRSRTRSPYRRRSPSSRRECRSYRSRSHERSRSRNARSKSPRKKSPPRVERKSPKSLTPPPRKPTVSESSDSSSSSSSSSSSDESSHTPSPRRSTSPRRSSSPYRRDGYRKKGYRSPYSSEDRESNTPVEERRIVFVGKLEAEASKTSLRSLFSKFGTVLEVRLHTKEDGSRYGFVTFKHARDAWQAVESASSLPQYDVGFGGRRAFCRQSYADLDGLEAKYTESAFHGAGAGVGALPSRRSDDMSFEQMLLDMRRKLQQRKSEQRTDKP